MRAGGQDSSFGQGGAFDALPDSARSLAEQAGRILVPDAQLLFSGHYARHGLDLVISDDNHSVVVGGYFKGSHHDLVAPDGAILSARIVDALAGSVEFAQASTGANAAKVIGTVVKLTGTASAIRNGVTITLNVGD